jgi:hypothetical protein
MPDIPEVEEKLYETVKTMTNALSPIMARTDPNLNLNALLLISTTYAVHKAQNQDEIDQIVEGIYGALKMNTANYFQPKPEQEQ